MVERSGGWWRDRVVLVTGGSRGLGLELARQLLERGARVSICGRDEAVLEAATNAAGYAEGLTAEVRRDGVRVTTVVPGLMRTGSHVNALFKGRHRAEYSWFAPLASLPLISMSAPRAARRTLRAVERGRSVVSVGLPAALAGRVHGLMPATTVRVAALASRLLPEATGDVGARFRGWESETPLTESPLTVLGRRSARDRQQVGSR